MCVLVVLRGVDPQFPVVVGALRDEFRDRPAAPPGLHVGERHRILAPRDRRAGGTWIGVNDVGLFAGLTNVAGHTEDPARPSRGVIPHLALDHGSVDTAAAAVEAAVGVEPRNPFQLLLADASRCVVLRQVDGAVAAVEAVGDVVVISNRHRLGELEVPGVERAMVESLSVETRLDVLGELLLQEGLLKRGDDCWGTVSGSLVAVAAAEPSRLQWRYSAGSPDRVPYRNYSNLARRLAEG